MISSSSGLLTVMLLRAMLLIAIIAPCNRETVITDLSSIPVCVGGRASERERETNSVCVKLERPGRREEKRERKTLVDGMTAIISCPLPSDFLL